MAATLRELRDPLGWAVAVLALLANVILRAGWMKAAIVALVVLAVRVGAGVLWPRPRPSALPAPAVDQPRRRGPATPGSKLTPREMEVAALIPEGLTNRQIGYRLRPQALNAVTSFCLLITPKVTSTATNRLSGSRV